MKSDPTKTMKKTGHRAKKSGRCREYQETPRRKLNQKEPSEKKSVAQRAKSIFR